MQQNRGGKQGAARRRTGAIHKHLLDILIRYLGELLGFLQVRGESIPSELRVRKYQAESRLEYLEKGNFPESKSEVLPGLRQFVHVNLCTQIPMGEILVNIAGAVSSLVDDFSLPPSLTAALYPVPMARGWMPSGSRGVFDARAGKV